MTTEPPRDDDIELAAVGLKGPHRLGCVYVDPNAGEDQLPPGSKILYRVPRIVLTHTVLRDQLLVASPEFDPIESGAEAPEYRIVEDNGAKRYAKEKP